MLALIAPDSFKGTFGATEVAAAIASGVQRSGARVDSCPLADGGEGTLDVLLAADGWTAARALVRDPLGREVQAQFGLLAASQTALVEVAAASGLPLLAPHERDPERADTTGTGELIAAAIAAGARTILVAAGGSATVDGGRGAIEALRASGADLDGVSIEVLCDVQTAFEDAARVFGPQKGASPKAVERLAARLDTFAATLPRHPRGIPMSGCAGGLSGGLAAAFGAQLRAGAPYVLERLGFAARLEAADAVVTGEGRIDDQSLNGKVVGSVAELCAAAGKPVHAIVGSDALGAGQRGRLASIGEGTTLEEIAELASQIFPPSAPA